MSAAQSRLKQACAAGRSPEARTCARGFTLLELLVVLALLGLGMAAVGNLIRAPSGVSVVR